jgi:hypothetical protein
MRAMSKGPLYKRLRELAEFVRHQQKLEFQPWLAKNPPVGCLARKIPDFVPAKLDPSLLSAFRSFSLDHAEIGHWLLLATYLAQVCFPKRHKGGRPKTWSTKRLCQLLQAVDEAKIKLGGEMKKDRPALLQIAKNHPEFTGYGPEALRKALQAARSRSSNDELRKLLEVILPMMKNKAEADGYVWTEEVERRYFEEMEGPVADWIGSESRRNGQRKRK